MYTCCQCHQDYPYLIFEYNTLVCEKCSIRKNVTNCAELDIEPIEIEEAEASEILEDDVDQLMEVIGLISNPKIREDFFDLAEQYLLEAE